MSEKSLLLTQRKYGLGVGAIYGYMRLYTKEEKLNLAEEVGLTKEVHDILRRQKRKQKISMAKIVCNLVIEKYEKHK